jgi:colicin import membrane protein
VAEQKKANQAATAESDQVQTTKEANAAREDAAKLRGQVEAMQAQFVELMRVIGDRSVPDSQA